MAVSGVGTNPYNYNAAYTRNRSSAGKVANQSTAAVSTTPSNITLHIGSEDDPDGKAIGLLGFPDGSSTSVFKGQNYTTDHPVFTVKTWDADGNMTETEIDASKVDPGNASLQEMMALNANRQLNGEEDFGDQLMMSAGRLHGDEVAGSYEDFFSKNNWMAEIKDFMDMQYQLGNMAGYLQYKKAYDIMQAISDHQTSDDSNSKSKSASEEYSKALADYAQTVKDKIENGETETSYQIGGQSFTEKEWEKLISKIDKSIDTIKEEVKAEAEQEKEKAEQEKLRTETVSNTDTASETNAKVADITTYYNGKEVDYKTDMLHDRKIYDAETGVTWYLNDQRGPYISGEDADKFNKWCEENGANKLKKFAEMTGLIRNYPDGTTAYVADNGIAIKGKDGTEISMDYSDLSWYAIMDALDQMDGNPLEQQTWNKVMQNYEANKVDNDAVTEAQIQELLKDNNSTQFDRNSIENNPDNLPSFVGKVYSKEELYKYVEEQVQQNQGGKMTLEDMVKASCDNWETASFGFVGESKLYSFHDYIQELEKRLENVV